MPISKRINSVYIADAVYGPIGHFKGTSMKVVLGPAVGTMYRGTPTRATSIAAVMRRLKEADPDKWVAGHLLAGELGGSGTAAKNLTPLTQNANKRMSSQFELKVKAWTVKCRQYMQMNRNTWDANQVLGVFYQVIVSANAMDHHMPYRKAADHLTILAEVRLYNGPARVNTLPTTIRNYFGQVRLRGDIYNDFADL